VSVEVVLLPGSVRVVGGETVSVMVPLLLFRPDQDVLPKLALSNVRVGLLPCAPFLFHVNEMLETLTLVYGLVIVMLITVLPFVTLTLPEVILLQLDTGVEVPVGVDVNVAVAVGVAVFVLVGTGVSVLLGTGVLLGTDVLLGTVVLVGRLLVGVLLGTGVLLGAGVLLGTSVLLGTAVLLAATVLVSVTNGTVAVGVSDGTVAVTVGVSEGTVVPGVDGAEVAVFDGPPPPELDPRSTYPRMVRALWDLIGREPIGIRLIRGL